MKIIIYLLAIIAATDVFRLLYNLIISVGKSTKKEYFKSRREGTRRSIWDLEFKLFKTREIRESVRIQYDASKYRLSLVEQNLKDGMEKLEKNEITVDEYNRLVDKKDLIGRDIKQLEEQMKALDIEMEGAKPSSQYPEGAAGIQDTINSLRSLLVMLEDWIKEL